LWVATGKNVTGGEPLRAGTIIESPIGVAFLGTARHQTRLPCYRPLAGEDHGTDDEDSGIEPAPLRKFKDPKRVSGVAQLFTHGVRPAGTRSTVLQNLRLALSESLTSRMFRPQSSRFRRAKLADAARKSGAVASVNRTRKTEPWCSVLRRFKLRRKVLANETWLLSPRLVGSNPVAIRPRTLLTLRHP
jgi:hypothetical protein